MSQSRFRRDAHFLVATRDGPTMLARFGIMRTLNHHVPSEARQRVFDPSRKETHWGRHKLARPLIEVVGPFVLRGSGLPW
jgi:hypothetical protein